MKNGIKTQTQKTGPVTFLSSPEDLSWLSEVHLHGETYGSALLYGNEDWPLRIECYKSANPLHDQKPDQIYAPDEQGTQKKLIG